MEEWLLLLPNRSTNHVCGQAGHWGSAQLPSHSRRAFRFTHTESWEGADQPPASDSCPVPPQLLSPVWHPPPGRGVAVCRCLKTRSHGTTFTPLSTIITSGPESHFQMLRVSRTCFSCFCDEDAVMVRALHMAVVCLCVAGGTQDTFLAPSAWVWRTPRGGVCPDIRRVLCAPLWSCHQRQGSSGPGNLASFSQSRIKGVSNRDV